MKVGICRYYSGVMTEACDAEINYHELLEIKGEEDEFGMARRLPCMAKNNSTVVCNKRDFPSEEEVENHEKEMNQRFGNTMIAIGQIAEKHGIKPGGKPDKMIVGTIECPSCKGTLSYRISPINGHIWGRCKTKKCLQWMM